MYSDYQSFPLWFVHCILYGRLHRWRDLSTPCVSASVQCLYSSSNQEVVLSLPYWTLSTCFGQGNAVGSEAVGALSSEAWNSASCQVHELKLASWMIDMWPRHPLTQSPANLTASHSYTNEPSKDLKACPIKPRLNCSTAELSTGKAGCCFKPLSFGLAC